MEKIRVNQKSRYEIEVNDNGDKIYLDVNDTRLLGKLLNMIKDLDIKKKEFEAKFDEIISREDKPLEEIEGVKVPITQNFVDYIKLTDDFCELGRSYIDDIFGKGASLKIFGESNNPDMFEEFLVALEPHLQKNKINMTNMKKDLVQKYTKQEENGEEVI